MAVEIKSILWDFGNGKTSNELYPSMVFTAGSYTITMTITDTDDNVTTVTKDLYISVSDGSGGLVSANYIDHPKVYHFGWKEEHGFGWSMIDGHFPMPINSTSVSEYEEDGVTYTLVWDYMDMKEYVINTKNTHLEKAVYKDKAEIDGTGGFSIPATIVTPDMAGEMKRYDITHLETNINMKPDLMMNSFTTGQEFSVSLITEFNEIPVETRADVDDEREINFYYENIQTSKTSGQRQLKIETTESNFQLLDYESFFKTSDRYKKAGSGLVNESMVALGRVKAWYTRGKGYGHNRANGTTFEVTGTTTEGADGRQNSACNLMGGTIDLVDPAFVLFWGRGDFHFTGVPTDQLVVHGEKNGWTLYSYTPVTLSTLSLIYEKFDVRAYDTVLSNEHIEQYYQNIELYLPRC